MSRGCKCTAAAGEEGKSEQVEAYYRSGRAYVRPREIRRTHTGGMLKFCEAERDKMEHGECETERNGNSADSSFSPSPSPFLRALSLSLSLCGGKGGDGARPRARREDARKGGNWRFASIALKAARNDRRNLVTGESQAHCAHPRRVARSGSAEARISTKRP